MMRLSRLTPLRALAVGQTPYLGRGMGPVRHWLYTHELIAWDDVAKTVVLTDKGRTDMEKANNEYAARPKHCTPRAWLLRLNEKILSTPQATALEKVAEQVVKLPKVDDPTEAPGVGILTVTSDLPPEKMAELRERFNEQVRKMGSDRMVVVLPPTDVVNIEINENQVGTLPPETVEIEDVLIHPLATEQPEEAPPLDDITRKRLEKERIEKAAQLTKEMEAARDSELKFVTELSVLDAYREIAIEIGNLGQGVEDVYIGKLRGTLIQFNPFLPSNAIVFYPNQKSAEKLMAGYEVAKALITHAPPNAVAFDGMDDLHDRMGAPCWRCHGTGNLSRNYTVNDKLCPQCRGTGRMGGRGGAA